MDLSTSRVAVTGATGFIGRYLVRALLERDATVVAAVRNPDRVPSMRAAGVEMRRADLADPDALADAFAGCDAVISNAGMVSIGAKGRRELMAINAAGTRNVFGAIHAAGVRRALMTSSVSAYRRKWRHEYTEDDELMDERERVPRPLYYAQSKAAAERQAWRVAEQHGIELSVARPGGVYGAFDQTGFTSWMLRFMRVPLVSVFPTRLHIPSVYAGDLAEAMVRMLERPETVGRAYNLTGPEDVSFWHLLEAYREAGGSVPRFVVPLPVPLRFRYSTERAERELGFENRSAIEAFRELLALEAEPALAA